VCKTAGAGTTRQHGADKGVVMRQNDSPRDPTAWEPKGTVAHVLACILVPDVVVAIILSAVVLGTLAFAVVRALG